MNKYIIKRIKDTIEDLHDRYAQNYVALKELESKEETPESKKNVESAKHNMEKALEKIEWYKNLLKAESL